MNSESGQRLSLEELKRRNRSADYDTARTVPARRSDRRSAGHHGPGPSWSGTNGGRLERLEASVSAQEALFRALSRQVGQLPTQAQLEALARDVAQMRAELKQAGKKKEISISAAQSGDGAVRTDLAGPDPAGDAGGHGGLADDLVRLGRSSGARCRTLIP